MSSIADPNTETETLETLKTQNESLKSENHLLKTSIRDLQLKNQNQKDSLALVSHEIKTPVGGMISIIEFLRNTPLNETQVHYINALSLAAENLSKASEDMLDFACLQSGHLSLKPREVNLTDLLSTLALSIATRAEAKGLSFKAEMERNVPETIWIDPGRFNQIINNLANNALKFTEQGEISLKISSHQEAGQAPEIFITIKDTGMGIGPTDLETIFEPFIQGKNNREQTTRGTGLGLWISKQLSEKLDGSLSCESTLNEGSTFKLSFKAKSPYEASPNNHHPQLLAEPQLSDKLVEDQSLPNQQPVTQQKPTTGLQASLNQEQSPQKPENTGLQERQINSEIKATKSRTTATTEAIEQKSSSETEGAVRQDPQDSHEEGVAKAIDTQEPKLNGHVLIVEDNKLNQMLIKVYLEKVGVTYDAVENGLAALMAVETCDYNCILMDIMMPEMDGLQASKEMHERWTESQHIPIIALSASANEANMKEYQQVGIEDYVAKPIRGELFYKALTKFVPKADIEDQNNTNPQQGSATA